MRLLRDLLARDPANPRCHLAIGQAYWDRGDAPAARRHFREALRLNPRLDEVRKLLRMGRRTDPWQMPAGWRLYQQVVTWDENGHKIVQEL
jgi:tetratricopeptide (TPR) repeat protein